METFSINGEPAADCVSSRQKCNLHHLACVSPAHPGKWMTFLPPCPPRSKTIRFFFILFHFFPLFFKKNLDKSSGGSGGSGGGKRPGRLVRLLAALSLSINDIICPAVASLLSLYSHLKEEREGKKWKNMRSNEEKCHFLGSPLEASGQARGGQRPPGGVVAGGLDKESLKKTRETAGIPRLFQD